MGNHFVPLLAPTKPSPAAFRPSAVPEAAPGNASKFTPITFGLAPSASPQPAVAAPPCAASVAAPEVSFKRDGDRITQIQIRCSCGEALTLDCDYASAPNT